MSFDDSFTMTIGGKSVAGDSSLEVLNPATEKAVALAPSASQQQLNEAVAAAKAAYPAWSAMPIEVRRKAMREMGAIISENIESLARLLTSEQGKPVADARGELMGAVAWCEAAATMELPVTLHEDSPSRRSLTRRVPLGVVAAIVPWNYPISIAFLKIPAALVTGNTLVIKPSPFTPLTTLKIGELLRDVLPPGVLNVVSGGDQLGPWMTEHPDVAKVSFTGSTQTGRRVVQSAAQTLKRLTLELGGNDAAIVLADTDIEKHIPMIFWSAFTNAGQICMATKRLYVHESIYDRFLAAFVAYAKTVKVGQGDEAGTQMGPIQNRPQYERVRRLLDDIATRGQRVALGGTAAEGAGYFLPITIVDNPGEDTPVVVDEAFGPVLPVLKFRDIEDVIARANDSPYGLAGTVWSGDPDAAAEIAARIDSGSVWVNEWMTVTPYTPFGGRKQSGYGAESGVEGMLEFTSQQTLVVNKSA